MKESETGFHLTPPPDHAWYFAYGSNMAKSTMERRKFMPQESHSSCLPDFCLSMGLCAMPYVEPGFATIYPRNHDSSATGITAPDVHGVVHLITNSELHRIVISEGGNGHAGMGYQKKQVVVNVLDAEGVVVGTCEAVTFVTPFSIVSEDYWPSKRYLDLCVEGAKQHDVPEDYVKWLASHRCYDPAKTTFGKKVGKFAMLGIACFNVIPVIPVGFLFIRNEWQPPWIVTWWIQGSFTMLRFFHTYGLKHLFGSGINHLDLEIRIV